MTSTTDQTRVVPVAISAPKTLRRDRWWVAPLITVVVLGGVTIYGTWAALVNKDYYRAFFWSPPACAVRDARPRYGGESRFPLILQNVHRIFFYLILPFPIILLWDGVRAFDFPDGFGMGVGTVVLLVNAVLLGT